MLEIMESGVDCEEDLAEQFQTTWYSCGQRRGKNEDGAAGEMAGTKQGQFSAQVPHGGLTWGDGGGCSHWGNWQGVVVASVPGHREFLCSLLCASLMFMVLEEKILGPFPKSRGCFPRRRRCTEDRAPQISLGFTCAWRWIFSWKVILLLMTSSI